MHAYSIKHLGWTCYVCGLDSLDPLGLQDQLLMEEPSYIDSNGDLWGWCCSCHKFYHLLCTNNTTPTLYDNCGSKQCEKKGILSCCKSCPKSCLKRGSSGEQASNEKIYFSRPKRSIRTKNGRRGRTGGPSHPGARIAATRGKRTRNGLKGTWLVPSRCSGTTQSCPTWTYIEQQGSPTVPSMRGSQGGGAMARGSAQGVPGSRESSHKVRIFQPGSKRGTGLRTFGLRTSDFRT